MPDRASARGRCICHDNRWDILEEISTTSEKINERSVKLTDAWILAGQTNADASRDDSLSSSCSERSPSPRVRRNTVEASQSWPG